MLAHERTLMAWTRTATSLISFGFTIFTFFNKSQEQPRDGLLNYVTYSLTMMTTGLASLAIATWRYHGDIAKLSRQFGTEPRRTVEFIAFIIAALGFLGIVSVILRSLSQN